MSYGVRTFDAKGDSTLDEVDRLARLIFSYVTDLDETDSVTIPYAAGKKAFWVVYPFTQSYVFNSVHKVTRNGDTFTWTAQTAPCLSHILIFLYT